ncbi:hypothetical protein [Sphingomonas koreensis]|jgi:hypothetical protein|uniref:hypothetical protein n=1 Tax=Sphingomonas koreensis TaxID=93064 RepID=UPI000F7EA875|nr:hypothetical protein [Sphingomonas koreensis]MDC7808737.1 hypothetical protein [Sphingomonas koreensis]RSU99080.1 hypothetical protein CA256_02820 [Sphingomonas koreensis]
MRAAFLLAGLAAATPAAAQAQALAVQPLAEARLRYEQADQDGLAHDSDALTLRVRAGVQASHGPFLALAEAQANLAIAGDYYDGLQGAATRPLIADPQNVALYRAQLGLKLPFGMLTAGRQRILLDEERFVGGVGFRQNGQSFDAVRAEVAPLKGLKADIIYAWSVRTIWGVDGTGARQRAVGGDNIFANLSYVTPVGTFTGFGYWVDQDKVEVQGYRLSSKTFGARLAGTRPVGKAKLGYQLSFARQSDMGRNPNDYVADYWLAEIALDLNGPKLGAGYEVLGASSGAALTSFQTPLGTNFKFQGWADKYLTTPPNGVRDLYVSAGWGWKAIGPAKGVTLQAVWHRYESDRLTGHYGDELNLMASAKFGKTTASVRFADYQADLFATDTRKFWLQLDWTI